MTKAETLHLAQRLTERDRFILALLEKHRVLTTPQITEVAFNNQHTAAQRLRVLAGLGLVARFRPRLDRGSAPWHYVLDAYGALALAVERGDDADQHRVRRDRQLALASSSQLSHRLGISGFFTALLASARSSDGAAELVWSRNASETAGWVDSLAPWLEATVRPDGAGCWREHHRDTAFVLEWDTGSEPHQRLTEKLERYERFIDHVRDLVVRGERTRIPWVLFALPSHQREVHARAAFKRHTRTRWLPVATTHQVPEHSPAEGVWRVLGDDVAARWRLAELAAFNTSGIEMEGDESLL